MKTFILSAGMGTRLRPLTNTIPKVMVPIGGKPVLEHLILLCRQHGFTQIVINVHYLPEVITKYFKDGSDWNVHITYSFETQTIMGGAGALKHAQKVLEGEDFFVLNGDCMTAINLKKMAAFHKYKKGIGTVLVHDTDHPYDSDIVDYNSDKQITRFFRPQPGDTFKPVSKTGTHIFTPDIFKYIPAQKKYSLEKELIPDLLSKNEKIFAYYSNEYSKDMGTPQRLAQVRHDFSAGRINPS